MSKLELKKTEDIEVFLDPFRSKIMRVMRDRHEPMTVKQIADVIGEVPAKVHYHVKKLESIGVLAIKYTREINGIIAKYYDFTTDTVALCVSSENNRSEIWSRVAVEYGRYYDEAKQNFLNLYNVKGSDLDDNDVYLCVKDDIPVDPAKIENLMDEIKALFEKYRYTEKDAVHYSAFLSFIKKQKRNVNR